jgi:hypothetical protein
MKVREGQMVRREFVVSGRHPPPSRCAAASMRYHDEIRVFSGLMAKSVVGNNQ